MRSHDEAQAIAPAAMRPDAGAASEAERGSDVPSCGAEPLVSIVVPVHNGVRWVDAAYGCLTEQGLSPDAYEIVFIDDASTDGSREACERLAEEYANVRCIALPENGGAGVARNRGIDAARGRFLYFFDIDDGLKPGSLARLCGLADDKALDVLYFAGELVYETPELEQTDYQDPLYFRRTEQTDVVDGRDMFILQETTRNYCAQPCVQLTDRAFVEEFGIRFAEGIVNEDNFFVLGTLAHARRAMMVDDVCYVYHVRKGTVTTDQSKGLKRFMAHFLLSDYCAPFAYAAASRGDAESARSWARLNGWFMDCAREALLLAPDGVEPECPPDVTPMSRALFDNLYLPFLREMRAARNAAVEDAGKEARRSGRMRRLFGR